jgi:hypothetical protein
MPAVNVSAATAFAAGFTNRVTPLALKLVPNIHQHATANRTRSIRRARRLGLRIARRILLICSGIRFRIRVQGVTCCEVGTGTENRLSLQAKSVKTSPAFLNLVRIAVSDTLESVG